MLSIDLAARIMAILVGIGVLQSSLELLSLHRELVSDGLFDWRTAHILHRPKRAATEWMLARRGAFWLRVVVVARIVCSAALIIPFQPAGFYAAYAIVLVLSSLFLSYQIRFGRDGSSQISVIILAGLAFTFLMPTPGPFHAVGLYFIAAQAIFSYFAAGLSKLTNRFWRSGSALTFVLNTASYGQPTIGAILARRPRVALVAGWTVIVVEIAFPLALISPVWVLVAFLVAGALLHLATVLLIGLDTFFWAFTATFPAIIVAHDILTR